MAYTKLFSSIITSTIWIEDNPTRIVWITMLALADKNGEVQGSVPGLARLAGVSVEECDAALATFLAPDERSRTKTDEGRRIEEIDGGWLLLNHAKYRRMASLDDKKEQDALRQKRARARNAGVTHSHAPVTSQTDIAEAEADTDPKISEDNNARKARVERGTRLTDDFRLTEDLRGFASDLGLDPDEARNEFVDYWTCVPGARGRKLDWSKTFKNRCRELGKKPRGANKGAEIAAAIKRGLGK